MAFPVDEFLDGSMSAQDFGHSAHVEAAFTLLGRFCFADAVAQYSRSIRRIAAAAGAPDKFHMTTTVAMMAAIAERSAASPEESYSNFVKDNPDLFDRNFLARYYSRERLALPEARSTFLLPDLA